MTEQRYSVLLESEVAFGGDPEAVREELISLGLLGPEEIERLLSGKPVVLQRGLSHEQALRYQEALEAAGARSRLVTGGEGPPATTQPQAGAARAISRPASVGGLSADDLTLAPAPEGLETWMTCPKCGVHQIEAAECSACGVVVSKFTERSRAGAASPRAGRDSRPAVDEDDLYQGPARARASAHAAAPAAVSLKDLTGSDLLAMLTGVLASVGRMLLTAGKIAGRALYHHGRRALVWLAEQIRTWWAERRAAKKRDNNDLAAPHGPVA